VVLSRAITHPDPRAGKELLHTAPIAELSSVYSMGVGWVQLAQTSDDERGEKEDHLDKLAHFDTRVFDGTTPWSLFNVMTVSRRSEGMASCVTVGRTHVAAFMNSGPVERDVME
jgi:hypothetical protein